MEAIDIWRAAKQLVDRYADDAVIEASMRADAALDQGDMFNFGIWKRVAKAAHELKRERPISHDLIN